MLTMILSVVYYGHRLNPKQWMGVLFVFGGIGYEAWMKQRSEMQKTAAAKAAKPAQDSASAGEAGDKKEL